MVIAADYPFLDIVGTMLIFFGWVIWFWLLITTLGDVFRRHDISGWGKAGWTIFMIFLPLIGVLIYLGFNGAGIAERNMKESAAARADFDEYVKKVAAGDGGGSAAEIAKAKALLDSGAIDQAEFETLKAKALAH